MKGFSFYFAIFFAVITGNGGVCANEISDEQRSLNEQDISIAEMPDIRGWVLTNKVRERVLSAFHGMEITRIYEMVSTEKNDGDYLGMTIAIKMPAPVFEIMQQSVLVYKSKSGDWNEARVFILFDGLKVLLSLDGNAIRLKAKEITPKTIK